jgi:hypothetical protein
MKVSAIVVTRNSAFNVKTLHTLLNSNLAAMKFGHSHNLNFVNDDPYDIRDLINSLIKTSDRIVFLGYSVHLDPSTLDAFYSPFDHGTNMLIAPAVKFGIDWDMFREKINDGSKEPDHQKGLTFDTEVSDKISDHIYNVKVSSPVTWAMDAKSIKKKCKSVQLPLKSAELVTYLKSKKVNVRARTNAVVTVTHAHECLGNLMESHRPRP